MARAKKSRRMLEYVLYGVLALLVSASVWSLWQLNRYEKRETSITDSQVVENNDVGQIIESSIETEESIYQSSDEQYQQYLGSIEASANNVGGVYDETSY